MNPITLIRSLAEAWSEGERVKEFGFGYREKLEAQKLANEQSRLNLEQDPIEFARRGKLTDLAVGAGEEAAKERELSRAARLRAALTDSSAGTPPDPSRDPDEVVTDYEASKLRMDREAERLKQNKAVREEEEARRANLGPAARKALGIGEDDVVSPADLTILRDKMGDEASLRQARTIASARSHYGTGLNITDPGTKAAVEDAANRYVAGELSLDQARGLLGGVRGGLGPALLAAIGDRRGFSPQVRNDLKSVQTTRNIVDQMEELVENIVNAPTPEEKAQNTLLLQQFGQTTGTLLSRGFGERGVVTDRDVARATGLVPGWKAANFAPDYARRELALLREVLDRNENGIIGSHTQVYDRSGRKINPGAAGGEDPDPLGVLQ